MPVRKGVARKGDPLPASIPMLPSYAFKTHTIRWSEATRSMESENPTDASI